MKFIENSSFSKITQSVEIVQRTNDTTQPNNVRDESRLSDLIFYSIVMRMKLGNLFLAKIVYLNFSILL